MRLQTNIFNRNVHDSNSSSLFVTIEFIKKSKSLEEPRDTLITPLI